VRAARGRAGESARDAAAGARYDTIGKGYGRYRQPDPRIGALIESALGDADTVVDVGSGAGSYEPRHRRRLPSFAPLPSAFPSRTSDSTLRSLS